MVIPRQVIIYHYSQEFVFCNILIREPHKGFRDGDPYYQILFLVKINFNNLYNIMPQTGSLRNHNLGSIGLNVECL